MADCEVDHYERSTSPKKSVSAGIRNPDGLKTKSYCRQILPQQPGFSDPFHEVWGN